MTEVRESKGIDKIPETKKLLVRIINIHMQKNHMTRDNGGCSHRCCSSSAINPIPTIPSFPLFIRHTAMVTLAQIYGKDENIYGYSDLVIDDRCELCHSLATRFPLMTRCPVVALYIWFSRAVSGRQIFCEGPIILDPR